MKPEDELIDALLKEQARQRDADEELLAAIDTALDAGPSKAQATSRWRTALPLSIAAGIAICGAIIFQQRQDFAPELAVNEMAPPEPSVTPAGDVLPPEMAALPEVSPAPGAMSAPPALESAAKGADLKSEYAELTEREAQPQEALEEPDETRFADLAPAPGNVAPAEEATEALVEAPAADAAPMAQAKRADLDKGSNGGGGAAGVQIEGEAMTRDRLMLREVAEAPEIVVPAAPAPAVGDARSLTGRLPAVRGKMVEPPVVRRPHPVPHPLPHPEPDLSRENYGQLTDQPWKSPWDDALSTFSIDVDTASYTNVRRMIREGRTIQPDAVRIEELVNYFDYRYPQPEGDSPFAVTSTLATCPWQPQHLLARVAIKGREIDNNARPASNLVFLIDVSGSMQSPDKLPMLKRAMTTLIDSLDERDRVGIVVYAGTEGVVLSPTELTEKGKSKALRQLAKLESGGSTNGGAGLYRAYQMALKNMIDGGVNRVILATDGDFNVGNTGEGTLVELVKKNADKGVSLSVLGFGTGNLNDSMLEAISNDGNGNYFYVDGDREAKRIFLQKLSGTLVTIAKDVKIQVEFNPGKVKAYRLIGYANRVLRNQDFNNDKVDAGDIGAGHTVTAFYEIVPVGVDSPAVGDVDDLKYQRPANRREVVESDDWFTLKLRYKHPEGDKSRLIETPVTGEPVKWKKAGADFRMASAVALFGMKLRGMEEVEDINWDRVIEIAKPALADDPQEERAEFLDLVREM
ncbi:von Willebrand factor type A domain-containing protein [Haloferula sp. A504]|uniref:vWA domain-containing protein n=1 Tax=Haloferula sp. A504 TaxID=3373601 RepID=UPI0031CA51AF|nr:von Willebrand factor type A domain-containing protein [Verrucomicrobiaceae bacterium E54]